jgi:hypothetical protein
MAFFQEDLGFWMTTYINYQARIVNVGCLSLLKQIKYSVVQC